MRLVQNEKKFPGFRQSHIFLNQICHILSIKLSRFLYSRRLCHHSELVRKCIIHTDTVYRNVVTQMNIIYSVQTNIQDNEETSIHLIFLHFFRSLLSDPLPVCNRVNSIL